MSDYFRKQRYKKDIDLFVNFIVYLVGITILFFVALFLLNIAKDNRNQAIKSCEAQYSTEYCKVLTK